MYFVWVFIKLAIGFLIVMGYMNLNGKTQLSQLTPVDFIGNFIIGGIIGGVIYSDSIPFHTYIAVLFIGIFLIFILNSVAKHVNLIRSMTIGDPIPIIKNGSFVMENILSKSNKIDILNIASQLHSQGVHSFRTVRFAQIEPNGALTVVNNDGELPSQILIKNGEVRENALKEIEKDEHWLRRQLQQYQLTADIIYLAEYINDSVWFVCKDGRIVPKA